MIREDSSWGLRLRKVARCARFLATGTCAAQIAEFAVSLPLLAVLVVGIYDFGNAFNVKHRVASAAREAARFASDQPTADLSQPTVGTSGSVEAVATLTGNVMLAEKLSDCGMALASNQSVSHLSGTLIWTFTAQSGCGGIVTLKINRGFILQTPASTGAGTPMTVEATQVTLSYPYNWQFNRVIQLLAPGSTYAASSLITSVAVMQNLN